MACGHAWSGSFNAGLVCLSSPCRLRSLCEGNGAGECTQRFTPVRSSSEMVFRFGCFRSVSGFSGGEIYFRDQARRV